MQSAIILCFYVEEKAEQCFKAICDYLREHPSPQTFYLERADLEGMQIPFAVAALFQQSHQAAIDKLLCQIEHPLSDDIYCGVTRATEFNFYSNRKKVAQFWKGHKYNGEEGI